MNFYIIVILLIMEEQYIRIKVLFVRHGQTEHNVSEILAGQQPGKLTLYGQ